MGKLVYFGSRNPYLSEHILGVSKPALPLIRDRNKILLATNLLAYSLYINKKKILEQGFLSPEQLVEKIGPIFPKIGDNLIERWQSDRNFFLVKSGITPKEMQNIMELGISGLEVVSDYRRIYPHGNLLAHLVGYVSRDGKGLAGIERILEKDTDLSIDIRVQNIVREELVTALDKFQAIAGAAIVVDVTNSEILALVSLPDFDPHHPNEATPEQMFNRATLGTYELGSVLKVFTLAAVLESGIGDLTDLYDIGTPLIVDDYNITDYRKSQKKKLSLLEIITNSSNIGTSLLALELGRDRIVKYLEDFGLTSPLLVEIKERGSPILPKYWSNSTTITISYGYGIAITPLHLLQAFTALINDGLFTPLSLIKSDEPKPTRRIVSERTSYKLRKALAAVVSSGTGKLANVKGYQVGGKTGSAEKIVNGAYDKNSNLATFVGAFPINSPQYALLVLLDEPKKGKTGGAAAAPVAKSIIEKIAPILEIEPDD